MITIMLSVIVALIDLSINHVSAAIDVTVTGSLPISLNPVIIPDTDSSTTITGSSNDPNRWNVKSGDAINYNKNSLNAGHILQYTGSRYTTSDLASNMAIFGVFRPAVTDTEVTLTGLPNLPALESANSATLTSVTHTCSQVGTHTDTVLTYDHNYQIVVDFEDIEC
jgi:hypothetical protein